MFRNYFKTAWRNLINNKVYSALNIPGLATGMAVALMTVNTLQAIVKLTQIFGVFIISAIMAIIITIITISFQAIKTAIANPVKSLRTE